MSNIRLLLIAFLGTLLELPRCIRTSLPCDSTVYRCQQGHQCFEFNRIVQSETLKHLNSFQDEASAPTTRRRICLNVERVCPQSPKPYSMVGIGDGGYLQQCSSYNSGDGTSCSNHDQCVPVFGGISLCCDSRCVQVHNIPCVRDFLSEDDRLCSDRAWNCIYGNNKEKLSSRCSSNQQLRALDFSFMDFKNHTDMTTNMPLMFTKFFLYLSTGVQTRSELQSLLNLNASMTDEELVNLLQAASTPTLPAAQSAIFNGFELYVVNKLFVDESLCLNQEFAEKVTGQFFNSSIEMVPDFSVKTRQNINVVVADLTNNRITNLVPERSQEDVSMLGVSAMFMRLPWAFPFSRTETRLQQFYQADGTVVTVEFMGYQHPVLLRFAETADLQYLELPTTSNFWTTYVVLPRLENGNIEQVWKSISTVALAELSKSARSIPVDVRIPKFTFESNTNILDIFKRLGVRSVITPESSQLSCSLNSGLFLSDMFTKSNMVLNEDGFVLASTPSKNIARGKDRGIRSRDPVVEFIAHGPFIFCLINKPNYPEISLGVGGCILIKSFS